MQNYTKYFRTNSAARARKVNDEARWLETKKELITENILREKLEINNSNFQLKRHFAANTMMLKSQE